MVDKKMAGFIKRELGKGIPLAKIKKGLILKGFSPKTIDAAAGSSKKGKKQNSKTMIYAGVSIFVFLVIVIAIIIIRLPSETFSKPDMEDGKEILFEKGDKIKFEINDEFYTIKIENMEAYSAEFIIKPNTNYLLLHIGEESELDLNNNGFDDFYIKLRSIENNYPRIFIKEISEF